jgi:hypothetical protein
MNTKIQQQFRRPRARSIPYRNRWSTAIIASVGLVAAACGGSGGTGDESVTTVGATPSEATGTDTSARPTTTDARPTDQAASATTTTPAPTAWPGASTVTWFDHIWEFSAPIETSGESESVRTVSFDVKVHNPLTDRGYSLPAGWVGLRSPDGEVFTDKWAANLRDGTEDLYLELGAEQRGEWRLEFEVPSSIGLAELVIELGAGTDRRARVSATGVDGSTGHELVILATEQWSGDYSHNSAELVLTGAYASTSAGRYDNGEARPAPSFNDDRQADENEVFVHLDFEITEISTSSIIGINVNTFRIRADEAPLACASDAPGTVSAQTVAFSTTCPVPVDASVLTLEIGTDGCTGGCDEWEWTSTIDTAFLESFR